ncbi:NAD(P)-dependent oxidoreductase [Nonomuraea sp. NPDC049152]|uniref:NAD(P)-dependent oxidoreductase n=1 Tax=Nonomuraea sp. NPDC049152 TaxID=3154350 RepID=UPI0033C336B4
MRRPRALLLTGLPEHALARLREVADVVEVAERPPLGFSDDELADLLIETGASVLVTDHDQVRTSVLDLPLDVVACTGALTTIDLDLAAERGVTVLNDGAQDVDAVAELTLALLFAVSRHIVAADREVRRGRGSREHVPATDRYRGSRLSGRTFGIVGLGRVGKAVQWRAEGLGMRVIACDPYVSEATHTLPELLAEADVVSVHVPLTAETRGLIGGTELGCMREGAIYLNTSRGALHDLTALVEALRWGRLGGAGLDHFEGEWLDRSHPLTRLPNVVLTPRLGQATGETAEERAESIVEDIVRLVRGERPAHACTPVDARIIA